MAEINVIEATAQPDDLQLGAVDTTPVVERRIPKIIPYQFWSVIQALNFIELHKSDLRNPEYVATIMSRAIEPAIDLGVTNDDLDGLYADSSERRAEINLDPITENVYIGQRDPKLIRDLIVETLEAQGIESTLGQDLTVDDSEADIVKVSDEEVKRAEENAVSDGTKTRAEEIALKLGLELQVSEVAGQNLVIPDQFEVDSTDPYIKKVVG